MSSKKIYLNDETLRTMPLSDLEKYILDYDNLIAKLDQKIDHLSIQRAQTSDALSKLLGKNEQKQILKERLEKLPADTVSQLKIKYNGDLEKICFEYFGPG